MPRSARQLRARLPRGWTGCGRRSPAAGGHSRLARGSRARRTTSKTSYFQQPTTRPRRIDKTTAGLKTDASKLKAAFKDTPLELKWARAAVESLTRFEDGLDRMAKMAKVDNYQAIREGFKGLETSLDSGADQVEKVAQYTIPKVKVKGLRLEIEENDFWPEGKEIAAGMRKGAKGCQAAGKQMDVIHKELPQLRKSLEQSQRVVRTTREGAVAGSGPAREARTGFEASTGASGAAGRGATATDRRAGPRFRETGRKDVALALRQAEKSMSQASAGRPQVREGLSKSASLLRATQKQMQGALVHREDYERTLHQTVELTVMFAESLPVMLEEVETGLQQQETSLGELGDSIDRVSETVPEMGSSISQILLMTRSLMGLFAAALGLHAALDVEWGNA